MIILILIFGLGLRLISLNQSFWLDEATSGFITRDFSFTQIITRFSPGDFHPPLYYLILKVWGSVFGYSEIGLRSLSVVAGVASIYIVYLLARKLFNRQTALIASGLLATSGLHLYYSQDARMYVLASFFVLLAVYFFVKTIKEGGVGDYLGYGVFLTAAVATDYMCIFMLPVFWVWRVKHKKKFYMSHIIMVILGLLWLPIFIKQITVGLDAINNSPLWTNVLGQFSFKNLLLIPVKFMIGRVSWDNKLLYGLIVGVLGSFIGLLVYRGFKKYRHDFGFRLIAFWLAIPLIFTLVISLKISILSYFRLLYILPAFYILVALGVSSLGKNLQKVAVLLLILVNLATSIMYLTSARFQREDWRGLIKYIGQGIVVLPAGSQTEAFKYYDPTRKITIVSSDQLNSKYDIIWLMRYVQPIFDPTDKVRQTVENQNYRKIGEFSFNGVVVWKYQK